MNWKWYNLFNLTEFEDTGLVQRTLNFIIEGVETEITIFRGANTSILYDGVILPAFFGDSSLGNNPYIGLGGKYGCYVSDNVEDEPNTQSFWLGINQDV